MKKITEDIEPELIEILINIIISYKNIRDQLVKSVSPEAINFLLSDNFREIEESLKNGLESGVFLLKHFQVIHVGMAISFYFKILNDMRGVDIDQIKKLNERLLNIFEPKENEYYH